MYVDININEGALMSLGDDGSSLNELTHLMKVTCSLPLNHLTSLVLRLLMPILLLTLMRRRIPDPNRVVLLVSQ
jgi:hypothetical protein